MSSELALFLEAISDGKWHQLTKLKKEVSLSERKVQSIAVFLNKFEFAVFDEENMKLKIKKDFLRFLART